MRGASAVLFVVDALAGLTPSDERLAPMMRRLTIPLLLVVNKVDNPQIAERCGYFAEFYALGLGEPLPVSAYHGLGIHDLLEALKVQLPPPAQREVPDAQPAAPLHVAVSGVKGEALAQPQPAPEEASRAEEEAALLTDDGEWEDEWEDEWEVAMAMGEAGSSADADADDVGSLVGAGHGLPARSGACDEGDGLEARREEPEERGAFFASPHELKLAVVGRPNVGKSSLINRMLDEERMVVHHVPGTTRDAIATALIWRGETLLVADTAGIRRQAAGGEQREELDRMAVARARQMIMACHVALLLFDAREGLTRGDLQIADLVIEHAKSCVLVANKVDLLTPTERDALPQMVASRLPMLWYAPLVEASALRGEGLTEALDLVSEAGRWRQVRVPRRRLNELFERTQALRPLPKVKAKEASQAGRIRVLYVLQAHTEAPTFVFHMNRQVELHTSDMRWMENTIRSQWAYTGTPLRLVLRSRDLRKRRRRKEKPR